MIEVLKSYATTTCPNLRPYMLTSDCMSWSASSISLLVNSSLLPASDLASHPDQLLLLKHASATSYIGAGYWLDLELADRPPTASKRVCSLLLIQTVPRLYPPYSPVFVVD